MSGISNIEWTDRVWNPVTGCDKVSPGCKFCYAEVIANRFWHKQYDEVPTGRHNAEQNGPETRPRRFTDVLTHEDRLLDPLSWKQPQRVFVNSMSDLFHEDVPEAFIDRAFAVMALARTHTFQILTKRADRLPVYLAAMGADTDRYRDRWDKARGWLRGALLARGERASMGRAEYVGVAMAHQSWPLPNVWLGVSCEDQQRADERIPLLLQTPATVHFVSAEPLLGPIDLHSPVLQADSDGYLDWVIIGGESGPKARPCDFAWIRSLIEQCRSAGVSVFVKQLGGVPMMSRQEWCAGDTVRLLNASNCRRVPDGFEPIKLNDSKGGTPSEWPTDLRVREFPGASA